jgi:hypothetical protein
MQQALRYESAACAELVDDDSFAVEQCRFCCRYAHHANALLL